MKLVKVVVLGPRCRNCEKLKANLREAISELGFAADIELVRDPAAIAGYGVAETPAMLIDGRVVSVGRVLAVDEIRDMLAPLPW